MVDLDDDSLVLNAGYPKAVVRQRRDERGVVGQFLTAVGECSHRTSKGMVIPAFSRRETRKRLFREPLETAQPSGGKWIDGYPFYCVALKYGTTEPFAKQIAPGYSSCFGGECNWSPSTGK
jgi:hypothetical protein